MIYPVKWQDGHDKEERQLATKLHKAGRDPTQSGNDPKLQNWAKIEVAEPKWATFATQMVLKVVPPLV